MGAKTGLGPQVMFALGVLIALTAVIGSLVGEFRPLYAGTGLLGLGLGLALGAWRKMRR